MHIRIGVTLGDPQGIGPEVAAKALTAMGRSRPLDAVCAIGPTELAGDFEPLCRFEAVGGERGDLTPGEAAGMAIERAVELAMEGQLDAIVTAPVHKPSLAAAGYPAGHTEMLAALADVETVGMLMCDEGAGDPGSPWIISREHRERRSAPLARRDEGLVAALPARGATQSEATDMGIVNHGLHNVNHTLQCGKTSEAFQRGCSAARMPWEVCPRAARRVLLATTHVALAEVPLRLTTELLVSQTRLLGESLASYWGIASPRIALCALNPHASDEGLFGSDEREVYAPAMRALERDRWRVTGPIPADTVFRRAFAGEFDAVVAPYHDVAMAAFKTVAFGGGVNVTLGLPFVRTSPDHGTAFDIAGLGLADPSSMLASLELAATLASRRVSQAHTAQMASGA